MTVVDFVLRLTTLRVHYPFSVTSWYRTPERNVIVGGHPQSRHLLGLAVDVVVDDARRVPALLDDARRAGLTAVDEGDHVHIQVP